MTDTENEVQAYLDYIKSMGIEAWIPNTTAGYSSKMSVAEQCHSKVLCLNYKGSDIYIRGNSRKNEINAVTAMGFVNKSVKMASSLKNESTNQFNERKSVDTGKFITEIASSPIDTINSSLIRSVGVQCSNVNFLNTKKVFKELPDVSKCLEKSVKKIVDIDNKNFFLGEGVQYKRIVNEKLTREVRVAKHYVSSLPNQNAHGRLEYSETRSDRKLNSSTYNGLVEVRKSWPTKGFVRKLVECYTNGNNMEK